jgi:hypothetical protein
MPPRRDWPAIGFLAVWMVFWAGGILTAFWHLGAAALDGEAAPAIFLAVWLAAAGYGLWSAARQLLRLLLGIRAPRRSIRDHHWEDGIDPPQS